MSAAVALCVHCKQPVVERPRGLVHKGTELQICGPLALTVAEVAATKEAHVDGN